MKKLLVIFCVVCTLFSCDIRNQGNHLSVAGSGAPQFDDSTSVKMLDSVYNFGTINEGEKVNFNFRFENTGKHPLIVASARASCGCTVPEKPEEPIQPGATGVLKVVFNSQGKVGPAHKTISVISNAYPSFPTLVLTGIVNGKN